MKNYQEMKESMSAIAEAYINMNEAFTLTKSNYVKIKSYYKLNDELIKFVVKKGGHSPTNNIKMDRLDVSKSKGYNIPEFGSLVQSLSYADEGGMDDLDPKETPWSNKMAKVRKSQKFGLELVDPDDKLGQIAVIRAQIFIIMTYMFEANPEFMKQYDTPEKATKMFI
jgi:hypothetical protein